MTDARPWWQDGLVAVAGIAAATLAIELLKGAAPVVSLGVLYVLPVLLVAVRSGVRLGIATAVASMLAYNWFLLPPIHRFTLADSRHWAAVAVLLVVAVVGARIAEAGRRQARHAQRAQREADLIADLARAVLGADRVAASLPVAAERLRAHLGTGTRIAVGGAAPAGRGGPAVALDGPTGTVGWLTLDEPLPAGREAPLRERIVPALGALLAAGIERERLADDAVAAETVRRSDEVKTTLLRTVSHDLRTPLTQIGTAAAALGSPSLEEDERRELATGIEEGTARLAAMIDKLLDLSRLEAGAAEPQRQAVPLDDLVRDALEAVGGRAARVTLEVEHPPPTVRVDPVQLVRAIANLLENAFLHGGGDEAPVLVRVAGRRGRAVVRVVDRGPGIERAQLDAIFRPFQRGRGAGGAGSGLGLAIARGFAEANGGTLRAESYPGQGAAFVLELPPDAAADATREDVAVPAEDPQP
ncbi:sensor histidine kinase [Patulibacter defluvii]|uniref:sensor histidine kinase n=1 Tax=Patulibacter defluvii TaxID=3095358 RepID=UPI002A7562EA|nr:ATP-binding protein [Patulibacter sp. DM4]